MPTEVRLIASPASWIDPEAVRQLYAATKLDGVRLAVGFPDLHPAEGAPAGAAFVTNGLVYPHLIGADAGCGMALFRTSLLRRHARHVDEWAQLPFQLEHPWDREVSGMLTDAELAFTPFNAELGTLGGGNHFAELQRVERVYDAVRFERFGLSRADLVLLVHSGSRGLGETLRDTRAAEHRGGMPAESPVARDYFRAHDVALRWARVNRALIARRFAETLETEIETVWDGCHNSITRAPDGQWVHRKGAVATGDGPVMIPGSRGSLTYLVKPLGDGPARAWSLAHGAGRKWPRSRSRARMRERFRVDELVETPLGGRVICEQRALLYEEAPEAYKDIEAVIEDLVDAGVASVIATFRPLLTYKTRALRR